MKNVASINSSHNKSIVKASNATFGCNCRSKTKCPLDIKCQTLQIIYKVEVSNTQNNDVKFYTCLTEIPFKDQFCNHTKAVTHKKYSKDTELSKYIWELKENNIDFKVKWSILKQIKDELSPANCKSCYMEE